MKQIKIFKESYLPFSEEAIEYGSANISMEEAINLWIKNNPNYSIINISGSRYYDDKDRTDRSECYILYDDNNEKNISL